MSTPLRVGIVGLGGVGMAVARRLLAQGVEPLGWRRGAVDAFVSLGCTACGSLGDLLDNSDVVLLATPASALPELAQSVRRRSWGGAARPVLVDLGVGGLAQRLEARDRCLHAGVALLDAPLMGNPPLIDAGRATIFASGDAAALDRAYPVLAQIAASVPRVGPFGHGTILKLASNLLLSLHTVAAAEAVALCDASGLNPHLLLDHVPAIAQSGVLSARGPAMAERAFGRGGGSNALLLEVIDTIERHVVSTALDLPLLAAARRRFERAAAQGLADLDTPSVVEVYRAAAVAADAGSP